MVRLLLPETKGFGLELRELSHPDPDLFDIASGSFDDIVSRRHTGPEVTVTSIHIVGVSVSSVWVYSREDTGPGVKSRGERLRLGVCSG